MLSVVFALVIPVVPALAAGGGDEAARRPGAELWTFHERLPKAPSGASADIRAESYRAFTLDRAGMRATLAGAPLEFTGAARANPLVISLPSPRGGFARFAVQESPVVAPELAERFPFIRTYNGRGIDDPTATIRFDLGRSGFHAQVLTPRGNWYIDPYYHQDQSAYVSYFGRDLTNTHGRLFDHEDPAGEGAPAASALDAERVVGTELRTYRLALATTGEYSTFHGGTVPLVHNELVVAVNRVTGVYERELAIRLQLVANNDSLINLNASTDPYTNTNPGALLNQNQSNVDSVIGSANYDIGHVFSTGGGGLASLAVVGKAGQKARGETGLPNPVGDAFYIDYVAHEMGHQFGANHPFNGVNGSCSGNAVSSVAMEPGSGSTIMAYAGICGTDDLQPHSDDYFHAVNFDEIAAYTTTPGSPGNLGASPSGNTAPTVTPAGTSFTIPVRTPFALSATGSDADPDTLTYTWEQFDGGALRALNAVSKPTGALFRSFGPTTSSTRVFPQLSSILANTTNANTGTCPALPGGLNCWSEFLPTVARTMNFRVSVRDNNPAAGGVNSANTVVTSSGTAPFLVTAPNTAVSLPGGTSTTVTWNVAATNVAPINTASVNILLSTDGGNTFPTTLVAGTPNDGSQAVTLPTGSSTQARVKVEASGNIFFDVSDANFTITAGGGTVDVFPSSFTIEVGTAGGGTATSLNADDDSYLVVRSTRTATKTATWYGTFSGVDNAVSSLAATYKGKSSFTCTQLVSIFRWTDSSWVQLDSRSVGTTEIEIAGLSPSGTLADFVSNTSGTGDVRIRVSCSTASGAFNLSGDLMKLSVGTGGAGTQTLTVSTTGNGAGTVTSSPPGIDCGVDCSEAYTTGTVVTLTATPGGSSTFTGWSGACTGTGACQVTMNAAASVTATFTGTGGTTDLFPSSFTVEVGVFGSGTAASLNADDDGYLVVRSTRDTRIATWYGTFNGVNNTVASLAATYKGKSSLTCTQLVSIFRWTDSTWVQLDSTSVGTTEVEVSGLTPSGTLADFVSGTSGTGDVRIRVSCSGAASAFNLSGDLMKLTVG